jgi:hypothetical protein
LRGSDIFTLCIRRSSLIVHYAYINHLPLKMGLAKRKALYYPFYRARNWTEVRKEYIATMKGNTK